jgi:hypothetical protein
VPGWAEDATPTPLLPPASRPLAEMARDPELVQVASGYRAWTRSLIPVIVSQSLDVASSYGLRELNPALAGGDGRFGMKAAGIKIGATAAILGLEYWMVKKHPRAARVLSKLNWASSVVTTGFAAHNFSVR